MSELHPKQFKGLLAAAAKLLKDHNILPEGLHLNSIGVGEDDGECVKWVEVPEVHEDPVTHKKVIVFVKKCVEWA
jgi:hypothetical protein